MSFFNRVFNIYRLYGSEACTQLCLVPLKRPILRLFSTPKDSKSAKLPKNLIEEYITEHKQPTYGHIHDKKPFKMVLKPNKTYSWCTCGWSKTQPLCDGSHKNPYIKIDLRPVKFMVEEEKEYYLCNCKQTAHRPFCDGTHKREDIQQAVKV